MIKRIIHISVCIILLFAAFLLHLQATQAHDQYAIAHSAAFSSTKPAEVTPEHFFDKAQNASLAVVALGIVSLVICVRTRRIEWFLCFALCAVMAVVSVLTTGVRY